MNEYKITIFDDVNKQTYKATIKTRSMFNAETIAIAECVEIGFHIDRIVIEGRE